ncbi:SDR family oxidoreductase [Thioclava sp. A2]|uniref:SDR family NAD(P)-dependent oxidoreductase n=1 Tax=Thioclava sp. FCG-A2 TaxID=3080562 RepID=UPI002955C5B2|nr:SDR family NAD(P)-dependent oxidoreductase [Thioclava sp. A2]MDV7271819.1 SDR family oxidoreductase [Thioclava sp. A2]
MHTTNQGIIVSGGSRGLGLHLVQRLLEQGNRVATFARSRTEDMDRLSVAYPEDFHFSEVDATDVDGITKFFAAVSDKFGRIHSVVNNAAIGQDQLLMHTDVETVKSIVDINIVGPTILTRAAVKHMMLEGGGNIVSISSICGSRGYAGLTVYAGSKGYLDAMTRSLAREVGEAGIFVNCVAPGFFESEMSSVLRPEQLATIKRRTPSGALSNDENIFKVVDLVVSGTTNMQGQVVFVDGGITS